MEVEVFQLVLSFEANVCCLECQHLYQPNPSEESLICLKTLKSISHELDVSIECAGYDEIMPFWEPVYEHSVVGFC